MARHSSKADFALLLGPCGELKPLVILETRDVIYGMVEVEVDVIGLQAAQASVERSHHVIAEVPWSGLHLGGERDALALSSERSAQDLLGPPTLVALSGVEVAHAAVEGVAHEVFIVGEAARTETDVGDA